MKRLRYVLATVVIVLAVIAPAFAQGIDPAAFGRFVDDYLDRHMDQPGVIVVLVQDGRIAFASGYGYADLEREIPMDPEATTLLVASIAKAPTALALLQQIDRGVIGLHEEIRTYLDVEVGDEDLGPLTPAHLLTHTDGFEARLIGIAALSPDDLRPLEETVTHFMPPQRFAPGMFLTYGDFAVALSGYLVERLSGRAFERYVEEELLAPLGMTRTTFRQVLPASWTENMAVGYEASGERAAFFYVQNVPAGGMRTTGTDMGRLMVALLDGGRLEGERILTEDATRLLFATQFRAHPGLAGVTYGLFEHRENGQVVYVRDGDGIGTRSRMVLFPDDATGVFVSYNDGEDELRLSLTSAILDEFYPDERPLPVPDEGFEPGPYAGEYQVLNWDASSFGKSIAFFSGRIRVAPNDDGMLAITPLGGGDTYGGFGTDTTTWVEVEPAIFERSDGRGRIAFEVDDRGRVTHLYSAQQYHGAYRKLAWHEGTRLNLAILAWWLAAFASFALATLVAWPISALRRRARGREQLHADAFTRRLALVGRLWGGMVAFLVLNASAYWFGVVYAFGSPVTSVPAYAFGVPEALSIAGILLYVPLAMALPMLVFAVVGWRRRLWPRWVRWHYAVVIATVPVYMVFMWYWNALG